MTANGSLPPSTPTRIFPIRLLETGQRSMTGPFHDTKLLTSKKTSFKLHACFYLTKKKIIITYYVQKGLFWILGLGTQNKIRCDPTEALLSSKGWVHTPSLPSRGSMAVVRSVAHLCSLSSRLSGRRRARCLSPQL